METQTSVADGSAAGALDALDALVASTAQLAALAAERDQAIAKAVRASERSLKDLVEVVVDALEGLNQEFERLYGSRAETSTHDQLTSAAIVATASANLTLDDWLARVARAQEILSTAKVPWRKAKLDEQTRSHRTGIHDIAREAPAALASAFDSAFSDSKKAALANGRDAAERMSTEIASCQAATREAIQAAPLPSRLFSDHGWPTWSGTASSGRLVFQVGDLRAAGLTAYLYPRNRRPPNPLFDQSQPDTGDPVGIECDVPIIPALIDLDMHGGLYTYDPEIVRSLVLKALAGIQGGQFRANVFDPQRLGDSVNFLFGLGDNAERVIGLKVRSTERELAELLTELEEHLTFVTQKYLQGQYESLTAYNLAAGEVAESYRALVLFDYPHGFIRGGGYVDEDMLARLGKIVSAGPRCGVYPLVALSSPLPDTQSQNLWDVLKPLAFVDAKTAYFDWLELLQGPGAHSSAGGTEVAPTCLDWSSIQSGPPLFTGSCRATLEFRPDRLPDAAVISQVLQEVERRLVASEDVRVDRQRVFSLFATRQQREADRDRSIPPPPVNPSDPDTWWRDSSAEGLEVPFGRLGARDVALLRLDSTTQSTALVGGRPGAGKSVLFHSLILGLCELYPPTDLELFLVDFKEGVEFKAYAEHQLPHARVVAIESDREFGVSVLEALASELEARGSLFRASGGEDVSLAAYRRRTGEVLARQLLIIDEFHVLFERDDKLAGRAAELLDRLVRQGRAFGIHVLLGSQTLAGTAALGRHTLNQIPVRLALQCSDADSRLLLADDNADAKLLTRPGEGILNTSGGRKEGNQRFQAAWVSADEREVAVTTLRNKANAAGFARRPLVFEGNHAASVEEADLDTLRGDAGSGSLTLGLPFSLAGAVAWELTRRPGCNLLVVGDEEDAGALSVAGAALAASAEMPVVLLDFLSGDNGVAGALEPLVASGKVEVHRRRNALDAIAKLAGQVEERRDLDDYTAEPILVLLSGLHRARDLEPSYEQSGPDAALETVLRDGPEVGVHVLATCDKVVSLDRRLSRSALREFAFRVAFRMGSEDSLSLLDSDVASKIRSTQAVLDDQDGATTVKFRPWQPLGPSQVVNLASGATSH